MERHRRRPSRSHLPQRDTQSRKNALGVQNEYSPWIQFRPRISCRGLSLQRSQRRTVRGSRTREPVSGIGNILGDQACERERNGVTKQARERERERERERNSGEGRREGERERERRRIHATGRARSDGRRRSACRSHFTLIPHAHHSV